MPRERRNEGCWIVDKKPNDLRETEAIEDQCLLAYGCE
jgi:hypothetical protein